MQIRNAQDRDIADITTLLEDASLPVADVTVALLSHYLVAEDARGIVGCIGLERYGGDGLLRSLAVASSARRTGLGIELVHSIEQRASAVGISTLWLLTTTASAYFSGLGYSVVDRHNAPQGLRCSTQFAQLCPASAVCMLKKLD
jgi:amino-acid N-acetyltransferase